MEVPKGVLPDSPQASTEDVQEEVEETIPEEVIEVTPTPEPVPAGVKTPQENLLAALQEERRKRKELEDKITNSSSQPHEIDDVFSDEGRYLKKQILELQEKIKYSEEKEELERLYSKHPVIKEQSEEFNNFMAERPGYRKEDLAKLFLVEKGVQDTPRKGLEKRVVGQKTPPSDGYTREEIADLRRNNHRKYMDLITSGKIRFEELK